MYSILVVDDELLEREGVTFLLRKFGYPFQIFTQANGKAAIEFLQGASVDVICSDIKMPFVDGLSLCEEAKKLNPAVKIVLLTAYNDFSYTRRAIRVHVDDYIMKPVVVSEFREVMDRLLAELDASRAERERRRELLRVYEAAPPEQRVKVLDEILHELQNSVPADEPEGDPMAVSDHRAIRLAMAYIRENYARDLTMDQLAEKVCLSKGYLSNLFKNEVGVSVMQYITMLRMQKARQLLLTTNMRLGDIGEIVGYHNQSYFCLTFKKFYGVTANSLRLGENHEDP
ncbi:MAG TPA: response regulator [Candidatus Gemmiger faecigallinarum]|nr:response regulator [Candidatus Gemmiger faecigallinarum]